MDYFVGKSYEKNKLDFPNTSIDRFYVIYYHFNFINVSCKKFVVYRLRNSFACLNVAVFLMKY